MEHQMMTEEQRLFRLLIMYYHEWMETVTQLQDRYVAFYRLMNQVGDVVEDHRLDGFERFMDESIHLVKRELNTILMMDIQPQRWLAQSVAIKDELLAVSPLSLEVGIDPCRAVFQVPAFFFRSRVASHFYIPYGSTKKHKLFHENQFWEHVIGYLGRAAATTIQPCMNQLPNGLRVSPFHYLRLRIADEKALDTDQYDIRPLVNALVLNGWLQSDSRHQFYGYHVIHVPITDDNRGTVEIELSAE
jgi:hypothetical protein